MNKISQSKPLDGKVAVITGAGRGIGRAVACAYAQAGAAVVCSARKENEAQQTLALIEAAGGKASRFAADVVDHAQMTALFQHAQATYGGVDIVLANASTAGESRKLHKSDPALWRETMEVNVIGTYNTVHVAISHLQKRGAGKIILTGSGSRHRPVLSAYASSKFIRQHASLHTSRYAVNTAGFKDSVN